MPGAVTDLGAWLRGLGLAQYEAAFRDNNIDAALLPSLTAEDLRELGVASVGHRRRLLDRHPGAARGPPAAAPAEAPLPEAAGLVDGAAAERRQVTVLFCDLAGSTALAARLDPEDLRGAMAAYHRAAADMIAAHGGYVAKFLGDGVLAYFGWPQAQEDDAERAVRAGLALAGAVAALEVPAAGPLVARVGIATGEVVVGDLLGEGDARERAVVGDTPNLAARLQAMAAPGTVLACPSTRRLTGTLFEWDALGPQALKGVRRAGAASRALGESRVESRFEALRRGQAVPLVGREEELELLLRRWRRARDGRGPGRPAARRGRHRQVPPGRRAAGGAGGFGRGASRGSPSPPPRSTATARCGRWSRGWNGPPACCPPTRRRRGWPSWSGCCCRSPRRPSMWRWWPSCSRCRPSAAGPRPACRRSGSGRRCWPRCSAACAGWRRGGRCWC